MNKDGRLSELKQLSKDEHLNSLLNNVVSEVKGYIDRLSHQLGQLSEIGRALSAERDLNALLEKIVDQARNFTHADACTLYIVEDQKLRFEIVQNDSMNIRMGGKTGEAIPFPPVALVESNVSAFVALKGVPVNIPDVYDTDLFDFTGPKEFDKGTGYRSQSMLVIPMRNHEDDVIGVLQLLNAMDPETGEVISFSPDYESMTESLASQAAVAITTVKLIDDMEKLFESFVLVMATACDEKSPVTGGHIRRVANMTMVMAESLHNKKEGKFKDIHYSPDKFHELHIASWMHDIGKVTTPVEIIEKGKKLQTIFDRIGFVDLRMQYIIQKIRMGWMQEKIDLLLKGASAGKIDELERGVTKKLDELREIRKFILFCNQPSEYLEDDKINRLQKIASMTYEDEEGKLCNFLTPDELENLSIRRGSITEAERQIMKNHAKITLDMLGKIPFTKKLKNIPNFAGAHHEFINGKGYPLGLKGDEIPFEGKLMAVTDVAEALTASDRPYKKAMPLDNVYRILRAMADDEELDRDLVEFFIVENVYEKYLAQYENNGDGKGASKKPKGPTKKPKGTSKQPKQKLKSSKD